MVSAEKISSLVQEWIGSSDRFLVEVKSSPSKVTVYIDKPTGITLQECAELSRLITDTLEPEGVWETHEVEVSSPGMDQPLRVYQQHALVDRCDAGIVDTRAVVGPCQATTPPTREFPIRLQVRAYR
ncbi:MAG: ribosome maturation factor RimP [Bacteroidota bacterium]